MKYKYCVAYDDGNIVIRTAPGGIIDRYDKKLRQWVEDFEMSQIYFGGIPVKEVSEKEALELIK